MTPLDTRPSAAEHAPFALTYIDATANALTGTTRASVRALLEGQVGTLHTLTRGVDAAIVHRGYAPDKWTLAESLIHVADVERVFAYRLLRIARADKTPLPGFDHDAWVPETRAARRELVDILTEIDTVRAATLALVRSLDEAAVLQIGTASGHPVSARALVWMIAGHFAHHLDLVRTRYLAEA
ncbi:MAG: DinB family protein [Gemmatimonadaceae bacterium]|nr:DinB family protein [Gemmatimonadaceae bacterium]